MNTCITCPETGADLEFELPGTDETLSEYWRQELEVHCPECGRVHLVAYRQAYLAHVMSEFRLAPLDIKRATEH